MPMTLREIRERFEKYPMESEELTVEELDQIIHDVHQKLEYP